MKGEIAGDFEFFRRTGDFGGFKSHVGVLGHIKKIRALQVLIAFVDSGVDAGRFNVHIGSALGGTLVVKINGPTEVVKIAGHFRNQVTDGERHIGVIFVDGVSLSLGRYPQQHDGYDHKLHKNSPP